MAFREIVKFLVVDADKAYAKYLQGALKSLGCKVTTCNYQEQALSWLDDQKRRFDIVVADAKIPFEMGFEFVDIVRSKINLPIIMMCSASDKEIISVGMNPGAYQVAVKPVGINDIQRFLQHALEHRSQHLLGVSNSPSNSEGLHGQENGSNEVTIEGQLYKNRLVWTEDLQALFVQAVNELGGKDVAVPKKIMERMNVPDLTRENIASHLQKYRLNSDSNYVGGKRKRKAAESSIELQVPSDGIRRSQETPTSPDPELQSFLAMDLSDPNFPFIDEYLPQDMSMTYGGRSNSLHENNYPVGLNDRITNDPATGSLIMDNVEENNPMTMHYPQDISPKGGMVDPSNSSGQQQEQIGVSPLEQPGSFSGLGTTEPSPFKHGTRNGYHWFVPKRPRAM